MLRHRIAFAVIFSVWSFSAFAAVSPEEKALLEELTGKKAVVATSPKSKTKAEQYLDAGHVALRNSNFVVALQNYNTVIQLPRSPQRRAAYIAKARLYAKMGLEEQAQLNLKLAEQEQKQNK